MQLVEHQRYGRGRVQKKRFDGFELYVEFEDGISRWVRRDEIRFLSETSVLKKDESPKPILSEEQLEDRRIIEALRLGVVPHDSIEQFTFGRDEEINHIKNWLSNSDDNNGSLILSGGYGAGKTHFLDYIFSSLKYFFNLLGISFFSVNFWLTIIMSARSSDLNGSRIIPDGSEN